MTQPEQELVRLKRWLQILTAGVVVLALATGTMLARELSRPAPALDRNTLNALISALYSPDHQRPPGPAGDPAVRLYDATYSQWRSDVVETFDALMKQ